MSGFYGSISNHDVVSEIYYGTDYHSHLGTKRGGMAFFDHENNTFERSIHSLENSYFRNKFEDYVDSLSDRYQAMVKQIAINLGLDSLMYQDMPDLVSAIGLPKERLCTHCWDGSSRF